MSKYCLRRTIIDFPIQVCSHPTCFYNPECSIETVDSILGHFSPKLKTAVNFLRINHNNPLFTVNHLKAEYGPSLRYFEKLFSQELRCTPKECLEQIRIYHFWKQMKEDAFLEIKRAFSKAGFSSRGSFEYAYRKYYSYIQKRDKYLMQYSQVKNDESDLKDV